MPTWQKYRQGLLSNWKHLICAEVCDYLGMESSVGVLMDVCSSGKVCGCAASFLGSGSTTFAEAVPVEEKLHLSVPEIAGAS